MDEEPKNKLGPDGLGYRAKFGVLVPSTNTIAQSEYESMRPIGVTNHIARMERSAKGSTDNMEAYRRNLERGTGYIKAGIDNVLPCEPDRIVLGHSINTFHKGVKGAQDLKAELEEHSGGVPMTIPSLAFLEALKTLGIGKKLSALSPYWPPGDELVETFFSDAGYNILRNIGLKCPGPIAIACTPANKVRELIMELAAEKPDAIIQPGTNLATSVLAAQASEWLNVPVLSCNTVTYWHALRTAGIEDKIHGLGPLFSIH